MNFRDIPQFTKQPDYSVTVPWDMLDETLARYNDNGKLVMDPAFQRAHVWTVQQQSRYVEYILRGGKSSRDVYFNQADWMRGFRAPMYLVDGKQRIQAVRQFLANELTVFGLFFSEFTGRMGYEPNFTFHVNDLRTLPQILQWYLDLNFGGTPHTLAEREKVEKLLKNAVDTEAINGQHQAG